MYNLNQYAKDQYHRSQQLQNAQEQHLADMVSDRKASPNRRPLFHNKSRLLLIACVTLVSMFILSGTIFADDKLDHGETDPYYEQMIAYRLGHYYYVTGDYERAIEYYEQAIDGIPEAVLARMSSLRDLYWYKGDALLKANQPEAALISYLFYLQLAGGSATDPEVQFVEMLSANIAAGNVVLEPLDAGQI